MKNVGEYHNLYAQCDILLFADVFEIFRDKCDEIYVLDPANILSAPGLAWQACFKKTGVKLELLTDIDMLLMVEEGIRGEICHVIHHYTKANNKYMNNYDKSIESSYIELLDANNLYRWAMSQKLPLNGFKWVEKLSKFNKRFMKSYNQNSDKFNERFIKSCNENSDEGYFLKVDVEYLIKLFNLHRDFPFLPERKKVGKVEKLACDIDEKEKYVVHIGDLKQALNHRIILKTVHRVIQFNQKAWLKP